MEDLLLVVALAVLSFGPLTDSSMGTAGVLAVVQVITMLWLFASSMNASAVLLVHASLTLVLLCVAIGTAIRRHRVYQHAIAGYKPIY